MIYNSFFDYNCDLTDLDMFLLEKPINHVSLAFRIFEVQKKEMELDDDRRKEAECVGRQTHQGIIEPSRFRF